MSRPIRIQYPGAFYHIISRGNARENIFEDKEDYLNFLEIFSDVIERYNWISYAYCLMPNHYHILIETPDANLSAGMRQLNGNYTQKFNIKNKRVGHLFQGRYKSILVEKDNYFYELVRYIALNPIRAKLVKSLDQWRWNSHLEIIGKIKSSGCVDTKKTFAFFGNDKKNSLEAYRDCLKAKIEKEEELGDLRGGIILGSFEFAEKVKDYFKKQGGDLEIPKKQRTACRPKLQEIFKDFKDKKGRNKLAYKANIKYGYSLVEIGKHLGIHYASVSRIINRVHKDLK